jgi:MFS family permease
MSAMARLPAYFCAAANLAAALALRTVLAPGTSVAAEPERAAYVRDHVALWRAGWSLWVLAAVSLLVFYAWWGQRVGAGRGPLALAALGLAADLVAESLLIAVVPDRPELARPAFALTGAVANGLYTLAGALLTLRTPDLRGPFAAWTWAMWASGAALSAAALLEIPLAVAAASAVLFTLFVPWCVAMGRRLA